MTSTTGVAAPRRRWLTRGRAVRLAVAGLLVVACVAMYRTGDDAAPWFYPVVAVVVLFALAPASPDARTRWIRLGLFLALASPLGFVGGVVSTLDAIEGYGVLTGMFSMAGFATAGLVVALAAALALPTGGASAPSR